MTTIFVQNLVFAAADELWTDINDLPAPPPFRKYYVLDDIILFFSGDISPILAVLSGYVKALGIADDYIDMMIDLAALEETECEYLEVDRTTGEVIYSSDTRWIADKQELFYGIGSGSGVALKCYTNLLSIHETSKQQFDFRLHGRCFIELAMRHAFRADICSGGAIFHASWEDSSPVCDSLDWPSSVELEAYHSRITDQIDRVFGGKEAIRELMAMLAEEDMVDSRELEIEAKRIERLGEQVYNCHQSVSAKGSHAMNNSTVPQTARVAVKTSGTGRGKPFDSTALKARLAQRNLERSS